jgi:predicted nucleic acid-binding protein
VKTVFADAFYFVGLLNRADQHHAKVVAAARQLRSDLLTTEWILAEFADALAESASRRLVPQFIRDLEADPKVKIIRASAELFQRGLRLYEARPDKAWSLTDCISFVVMEDEDVREALTGDEDFEQAGFKALLK